MLGVSDCVVLATPAMVGGGKLVTRERLEKFKWGARFVNIARGSLVSEPFLDEILCGGVREGNMAD